MKAAREARRLEAERKKSERKMKREARRLELEEKKAEAKRRREARRLELARKQTAATLARQEKRAARSKLFPSAQWSERFWLAVEQLHPDLHWDNPSRDEVYASIIPAWRVHRWTPEEAAKAVCLRCEVPTNPPQGAPVASGGRVIPEPIKATKGTRRASVLRPALLDVPDLSRAKKQAATQAKTCPADREECGYTVEGGACTITAPLTVPARGGGVGTEKIKARYCVVEIDRLHTSHQPLKGFSPDPQFPAAAQERDYHQVAEQAKVNEIAANFQPELVFNTSPGALDGVPVATEKGIVLGGNGRTMGTALVYADRGGMQAAELRRYLVEHAYEFGLTAESVEAFKRPMLVRTVRVGDDPRVLAEWSRRLNTPLSQQLDAIHLAVSRARFLDDSALRELDALGEDETLSAFLGSARSRGLVRALQRSGIIDGRAAQTYISGGLLNEQGRDLATDLLVAVLLPDALMIGAYGRGPVATLARAAPALVQVSQWKDYDLRPAIAKAVRDRVTMNEQRFASVRDYLRQGGLLAGAGPAVEGDPIAIVLLHVLAALEGAPVRFTRFARRYAELAAPAGAGQGALFVSEKRSPIEALREAARDASVKLPP